MLQILPVASDQIETLARLGRRTFSEAFYHLNRPEDIAIYLDQAFAKAQIAKEYDHPDCHFFFAKIEQKVIGYLKLNTGQAQTEFRQAQGLEIERIYITKAHQAMGHGSSLLEFAEKYARSLDKNYIWLGVWEKNPRAIDLYQRLGFEGIGTHIYTIGNDPQTDHLMRKNIR